MLPNIVEILLFLLHSLETCAFEEMCHKPWSGAKSVHEAEHLCCYSTFILGTSNFETNVQSNIIAYVRLHASAMPDAI